jgi:hypothetical protein
LRPCPVSTRPCARRAVVEVQAGFEYFLNRMHRLFLELIPAQASRPGSC